MRLELGFEIAEIIILCGRFSHGNLIDPMDDWLEHGNNTEL